MEKNMSRRVEHKLLYHVVIIPANRARRIEGRLGDLLSESFAQTAQAHGLQLHKIDLQVDHVRLQLQGKPSLSADKMIQLFKDGSSTVVRKEFPDFVECVLGDSFWSEGYLAETISEYE
jgi:REP element-mobilizing transposase RayT